MKITKDNFDDIKKTEREFLISEIEKYIVAAGSKKELSLALGKEMSYVHKKYKRAIRGNTAGLEKLYKECIEKIGLINENR